jgi:hypothetical protein
MYKLLIVALMLAGCSESYEPEQVDTVAAQSPKTVTIYGDSLCHTEEGIWDSWARRLDQVEGLTVTDLCIRGYRATYPIFAESIVNDTSDIFVMTLGVNDAVGILIGDNFAKTHGLTRQTIDDFRSAYAHIIGVALLNGSEVICVLPPITGVAWVQPVMPEIWGVITDICGDVGEIIRAAPSDGPDQIHYGYYGDELMYDIMLGALSTHRNQIP